VPLDGTAAVAMYHPSSPNKEPKMRAEAQAMVNQIEESLELLRRRL